MPRLTGVRASGSGDIDAEGVHAAAFDVVSTGSADITLQGRTQQLGVALNGSGDANLVRLVARDAHVAVGGSGAVDIRATRRLDARIDGSGGVRYRGHPRLTRHIDGSGDLSHVER